MHEKYPSHQQCNQMVSVGKYNQLNIYDIFVIIKSITSDAVITRINIGEKLVWRALGNVERIT
jgi:hypothetical protein